MTGSRSVTKPVAVLVSVMMLATTLALGPAAVAGATSAQDAPATPSQTIPDELGRETRLVQTPLKCSADGGSFGPLAIPFDVPIDVNSPTSIQKGKTFDVVVSAQAVEVPATFEGLPVTINNFTGLNLRALVSGGFEVVSVTADTNSGFYQPNGLTNPNAPKQFINPNGSQLFFNAPTSEVRLSLPGPYNGNSVIKPPNLRVRVRAVGENGDLITSQLGGTIPQQQTVFPWTQFSFNVTVSASLAGITTITAPAFCAPNFGRFSDIPGNDIKPVPFLSRTVIDDRGPDLNFRTPRDGFVYDVFNPETNPDSRQLIADFTCTDPSGVVSCEMTDGDGNTVVPGQRLPDTFNNDGELTLRATDEFGFVSERTIQYSVSSNSVPNVDAGDDIFAGTLKRVELDGNATDVDFGQLISYRWIQVAGPAVTLAPTDDPFDTVASFVTPPGPEELIFALRADDGQGYAEDFVSVFVDPNNAPQITNKQFQFLGFCPFGELADDQRCDDTPIPTRSTVTMDATATDIENEAADPQVPLTYSWRQVDENGNDLDPDNPELVTLSSTDSPVVTFDAPQLSRELTLFFEVLVSDGDPRADVVGEVTVRIRRNLEPVFGGEGAEQVIRGVANGNPVRMQALATDPEGRTVTYAWRQVDAEGVDLPEGDPALVDLTIIDPGAIVDFTSLQSPDPYSLYFRVVASDGLPLGEAEASIEVQVLGNEPPNFTNLAPPIPGGDTFNEFDVLNRQSVEIDASGTDPEGRALSYTWRQVDADGNDIDDTNPNWNPLDDPTDPVQTFEGPDTSDETTFHYAVVMSDGVSNGSVEALVKVTFGPNLPPTLEGGYEQFVSNIETRGEITLDGSATDPEGGTVSYLWSQVDENGDPIADDDPNKVTLPDDLTTPEITFDAPDTSLAVVLFLKLTVSDGLAGGSADALFTVSVRGNNVPVITAPSSQFGVTGLETTLDGAANDLDITNGDNQTLSWAWVQVTDATGDTVVESTDGIYRALTGADTASPKFTEPISNDEVIRYFRLTVSDGFDPVVLVVTVTLSPNNAPFANAGEDQEVPRGTSVTLNGSGTDPDGHSIGGYQWTQVDASGDPLDPSAPEYVTLSETDEPTTSFTAPNLGTADVVLYFELLVFDEFGQVSKDPDTVVVTVRNQAPTANAGGDQSGRAANSTVTVSGSATDPDVPFAVSYLWEQVDADGNPVTDPETGDLTDTFLEIADPTAASTTFVTPQTSSSATYYLQLTVTDDGGLTATDIVAIQVNPVTLAAPNANPGTSGTVGTFIQLAMPRPGAPGNPSDNFSYDWYQTDSTGSTTACAPTCIGGTAEIFTEGDPADLGGFTPEPRRPVIKVPGRADRNPATSFFRVRVADTFGGGDLFGAAVTITTTNTDPTVNWSVRGYGSDATARLWTDSTPNNPVWAAGPANSDYDGTIILDATENPAVEAFTEDLDGDTITYTWKQYNNPYTWGRPAGYVNKTAAVTAVTGNFNIPGGNRNCDNINLGGVNNLANGARVLLVGQNDPRQNGVWIVPNRSSSGFFGCRNNGGQWARAGDLDSSTELEYARVAVSSGNEAGRAWVLPLFSNQISVNSTNLNWQREDLAGPAGANEPIFKELANTGRNTQTPQLRATQSGSGVNTVTNTTGIAYLRTPVDSQFPLELTVTDGISAPQSFRMVVRTSQTANASPVATRTSPASQTIRGGVSATLDPVTLGATIDDAQARPASSWPVNGSSANENLGPQSLTYQWLQTDASGNELAADNPDRVVIANPDPTVLGQVASATAVNTTFLPPAETKTLYFRVRTTDGIKTSLSDVQTVVVQINRIAPVADAGEAQDDVRADQTVALDGTGSVDEDGTIDGYLWEQVDEFGDPVTSGPTLVTLSDPTVVSPTFTAPSLVDGDADLYFRLTVTDDFGDTDTDTVRIGVLEDEAPTAVAGFSPDPVVLGQTATLSGEGSSDPEGQTLSYSWVQEDGSGNALATDDEDYVELTNATSRDATFTVPAREVASTLYFRLTVADGAATPQDDSALVTIAVRANRAPTASASASPSSAGAGVTVTLSSDGTSDPDGDTVAYLWEQVDESDELVTGGDTLVTLSDATAADPTFTAPGLTTPSTLRFRLTASDEFGLNGTAFVQVEVAANVAPTVDPSASPNPADPGDEVTLSAGAADPEGVAPLTYAWTQTSAGGDPLGVDDPVVTLSDDTAAEPTFTAPGRLDAYTLYFEVVVTDEFGAETTDTVSVAVNANRAPTVTGSASPNPAPAGATVTLSATGSDPDGDDVTYAWVQVDAAGDPVSGGDLVTLTGADTASPTFAAPDLLTATTLYFRVTVADPYGATATTTVEAGITENRPPLISASASPSNPAAGATVTLTGTATDPEDRSMTYQWTQVDGSGDPVVDGVTITDDTTLSATFEAPGFDDATDLFFRLAVTDDTGVPVTTTVTVNVQSNQAPVASISGSAAIAPPGATVTLDGTSSSDPEGDEIASYLWSQTSGPDVTIVDPTAAMTSVVTPVTSGGLVILQLVVTDRWGKQSSPATLAVALQPNNNPFADAGEPQSDMLPGQTVTLDGSGSMDADGHEISFAWTQLSGPAATLSDGTAEQPTFVPLVGGDYLFELIVTDQFGGVSNPAYVLVKVNANRNPVVDAGEDLSDVVAATVATLSGTVSDPDVEAGADQTVTSIWTQIAGDPVTLEGDDPLTKTFRVPSTDEDQTLTFRLSADDGIYGGSAFDEVSIFVKANRVPVVDAGEDQDDVVASTVATLEATVTDADIEAGADQTLTYTWTQIAGDPVTLEGDGDLTKTFRVPSTDSPQTLTFRLTSGDGTGEGFDEVSVNVLANRVPTVDAGEDQDDVVASTVATLEATVVDADIEAGADQTLTYTWTQIAGDPVTLEGDGDLTRTFRVPATDSPQTLTFRLTSGDGTGEGFDEVSVNVLANRAPTVDAGEDQSGIVVGTSVTLTGTASDADIDAGADQELVFGWAQVDPVTNQPVDPAVSLIPVPSLGDTVEFEAPSSATAEEYVFAYLAFDGVGGVGDFEDFSLDLVTVSVNANRIPIVDAGEAQSGIAANEEVTLSGSATDPDIDEGSSQQISGYTWTQISGTTVTLTPNVDGTSATFSAPSLTEGEALVFQLAASDGTGEGTATVTISVNANRAPTAEAGDNLNDIEANDPVTLIGVGTDEDPQNLTYLWTQTGGDPVSDLSPTDQATITFNTPINNEPQVLTFELAVSDGLATTTDTVTVGVKANRAPIADAGPTLNEVGSESMVTLDGRGSSDPEGQALTYSWAQTAGTPVTLDGADTTQPTFMAPLTVVGASLAFTLTVTDPLGKTAESTVGVTVVPNRPPVADAGENQLVPRRRTVTLDGTGSSDPDGQAITYAWVQVTGVGSSALVAADNPYFASLSDVSAAQPTFLSPAPANDGDEIYFMLVVVDSTGRPSLPSWTTVTLNLNDPPVATAPEPQTGIAHNETVTLGVIVEDPDGEESFTYQWVQIDADDNPITPTPDVRDLAVELSDPTAEAPTFVAPYPEVDTELRFRVVVTDIEGATDDAVVTVEVLANRAPVVTMDADLTGQNPNTVVNLGGSAVDPDGDDVTYEWVQVNDAGEEIEPTPEITDTAVELTTTEGTTTSFTTPIVNSTPTLRFRLRATDSEGAFTDGIITVGLVANRAPTPAFGSDVYVTKQSVDAVQASNFSIPTGNRGCSDVNVGGRTFGGTGRVLLVGQNDPRQNGIWDIPSRSGTGFFGGCSNNGGQWRRAGNADSPEDLELTRVAVTGGSGNGQTWVLPLAASQISGFPDSNLNYGSTSMTFVRIENVGVRQLPIGLASSGGRTVNSVVTLSYPAVADGTDSDPDGTPSSLFTYRIVRVADANSTTPCADATCGGTGLPATVTEVPGSDGRQATFTVPGVTSNTPLYFKMLIDDGYGAVFATPATTIGLQNTAPSINNNTSRDLIRVVAGADVRIDDAGSVLGGLERTVVGGPGEGPVSPNNVFNDGRPGSSGNFFPQSTYVYGGVRALLDARPLAAAADPDGGATVRFQAGLQPVGTAIDIAGGLTVVTRNPNGVCQAGFTLQPTAVENVWAFTPPTGVTENGGYCRIQFQVSDPFTSPTTWGVPVGCLNSGLQGLVGLGELLGLIPSGTLPPCTEPNAFLHIGDRNQNEFSRAANVTLNRSADLWLQVFQNKNAPNALVDEIPGRVFSSSPGQEPTLVTLDGSDTIDGDGTDGVTPKQPLLYKWTALDAGTLQELPDDADANQRILDRGAPVTQFALPDSGPDVFRFRLDVYDGNQRDIIDTGRMRVTVRRPTADGTATLPGGEPQGTPADNPYGTAVPNVEVGAVQAGDTVALSSAGSANPDGRTLKYQWRIISGGASAEIQSPRSADATLVVGEPTLEGAAESEPLVVELTVRDGFSAAYKTFTFDNVKTEEPTVYCPDPTSTANYPFTDVGRNTSLGRVLACLVAEGVLSPNSRFNPANTFTRAQMILVLHRLAGRPTEGIPRANFIDVPNSGPVREALNWANFPDENGVRLVSSQSNRLFRPDDAMQRYELALFLHRYIGTPAPADPGPPVTITDLPASRLATNALVYFAQKGVYPSSGRINPEGATRRDFMADVVWKFGQIMDPPLWQIDPSVWEPRAAVNNVGSGDGEAVTVSCPSPATLDAYPFGDVPADASYRTATACLVENGVLKPNASFNPDGTFTRSQMLLVLHRLAGRPGGLPAAPFDDVPGSGEVRDALNWGFAEGLVSAQANRRFRPDDPMQRVELALFLWRSIGRPAVAPDGPPVAIVDAPSSGEYRDAVTYLAQRGVVEPTGFFNPSGVTLRSFMAETVFRFGQIRNPALWQADPGVWQPRS